MTGLKFKHLLVVPIMILGSMFATIVYGAGDAPKAPVKNWSWTGPFSSFDRASAQRGLQVYVEVCASCHGLDLVAYRHLSGIGYSQEEIKSFAANFEVLDKPNEEGERLNRPALASDYFVNPYENEQQARYV
ncbi:MAG: cytochrome c1, partial [Pseudomonadota bacterium]